MRRMKIELLYIYLVRPSEVPGRDFSVIHQRFIDSYRKFMPGVPHQLRVVLYNGEKTPEIESKFDGLNAVYSFYNGDGLDMGAYQAVTRVLDADFAICCNTQAHFHRSGWMERLVEAFVQYGEGLYGPMGSYEDTPHLRGPCMAFPPKLMRQYPHLISNRETAHRFESREWNFTQWVRSIGKPALMVTWDEVLEQSDWRKPDNIFRRGDQSNCLVWDRHTEVYFKENAPRREELARSADGKRNAGQDIVVVGGAQKKTITVVACTSTGIKSHATAIDRTAAAIPYPCKRLLLSPVKPDGYTGEWRALPDWMPDGTWTIRTMCNFLMRGLHKHIDTDIAVYVHWDGYAINPGKWTDEFLEYDYGGAPWPRHFGKSVGNARVGNGGFSIRSKRWLTIASSLVVPPVLQRRAEDVFQCADAVNVFVNSGCKVMPVPLAIRWSFENSIEEFPHWKITDSFGFHGLVKTDAARKPYSLPSLDDPASTTRGKRCFHPGDLGDIIAFLPILRAIGGGALAVGPLEMKLPRNVLPREPMTLSRFNFIRPLLIKQPYVHQFVFERQRRNKNSESYDYDLSLFRKYMGAREESLTDWQARFCNVKPDLSPWLTVNPRTEFAGKTVIARSPRYLNPNFDWNKVIANRDVVFIGLIAEHARFCRMVRRVPYVPVSNALEMAQIIAGSQLFIGNQSFPCWLAMGLGHPLVQESWPFWQNSKIDRPNARFVL